ncbi:MAG: branched-chain amino acid ABC transporter permease [Phycisphaerales bacterium]
MDDFLTQLISALVIGSLYALIALGYTMVYGILKFINFAHSDVFVLGAWSSLTLAVFVINAAALDRAALPWWVGAVVLVGAMCVCGIVGFTIERLAYRPLRKAPRLNVLITAIGVSLFLQNVGQLQFDFSPRSAPLAAGPMAAGERVGSITLDRPVMFLEGASYVARVRMGEATRELRVGFALGEMPAGSEIRLAEVAENVPPGARYELLHVWPLKVPFGSRPQPMPALLPDRALNATTVARGVADVGAPGAVRLDAPVEINPLRQYRLELHPGPNGAGKRATLRVLSPRSDEAVPKPVRLQELDVLSAVDEETVKGASFTLLREPVVPIQLVDVAIVCSAIVFMLVLDFLVFRTRMGTAMRAVSFNFETAALMGINVDRVISFTFVLGAVLAGGAGFLNSLKYPLNISAHESWVLLGLKAFVAAVVGGIGNVRGAALGGFLIAFVEVFGKFYTKLPEFADLYVFSVLILVLLLKPAGLLGSPVREKV